MAPFDLCCQRCRSLIGNLPPAEYRARFGELCDRCQARADEEREEQARRWSIWLPHRCELDGCETVFLPGKAGQRFCCDAHRSAAWRAERRRARAA